MRVLLVGAGGREHALAWKISQSPLVKALFAAPGNPGIARHATLVPLKADDADGLARWARENAIDFVVAGPEAPLVAGLVDRLAEAGIPAFGPTAAAAEIEGSKAFAKAMMEKCGVPTAGYREFDEPGAAKDYIRAVGAPLVVKADGLAAGKGVVVASTAEEALSAVDEMMVTAMVFDHAARLRSFELVAGIRNELQP